MRFGVYSRLAEANHYRGHTSVHIDRFSLLEGQQRGDGGSAAVKGEGATQATYVQIKKISQREIIGHGSAVC
jgi:hypothetical protein